jgi:RNA polymerase sigma-70 factor, ECF subfamily
LIFREVEDRDLVAKASRGDVDAYNHYILKLTGDREDAMDLSQEVFLKAYQNLGKLEDPGRFAPWLFRIAHNESFSLLRKQRPETEELKDTAPPSSGRRLLPMETSLAVEAALNRLTNEQRETVVLKIYQGFNFEEIGEILDCPVSTIKSRLYTALDLLKDTLAPVPMRGT